MYAEPQQIARAIEPPAVLVAEDDPIFQRLFQRWLEQWGYRVTLVEDGGAVWRELQADHRPRIVLLDWMMPGVDGVEICRRVRGLQREFYSYIIVVTAPTGKDDAIAALDAGADDYITKPVEINELRARIQAGRRILHLQDDLLRSREQLRFQNTHDPLTGLWTRRAVLQVLQEELLRAFRTSSPVGVLMLDLDHLKSVNDTRGHRAGDAVLAEVAGRVVQAVRTYDKVGRYGGEEFLIVVPGCSTDMLACVAERVRARVAAKPVLIAGGATVSITASIGGAVAIPDPSPDCDGLVRNADHAMYAAKQSGRNCCVVQPQPVLADNH